jgi:hypothetical protein
MCLQAFHSNYKIMPNFRVIQVKVVAPEKPLDINTFSKNTLMRILLFTLSQNNLCVDMAFVLAQNTCVDLTN